MDIAGKDMSFLVFDKPYFKFLSDSSQNFRVTLRSIETKEISRKTQVLAKKYEFR